jgi:sugar O-acyltransferase (sialic acid O-acetyltransferase NeuD family)
MLIRRTIKKVYAELKFLMCGGKFMENIQELIFLGGSTGFLEIIELVNDINKVEEKYKVVAVLDDDVSLHGQEINGIKVSGPLSSASNYPDAKFVFAIGSLATKGARMEIIKKLNLPPERFVTLVHPFTKIYPSAKIGYGCIIHFGSMVGVETVLGDFVMVTFNSNIGNYVNIGTGSIITSAVTILGGTKIGKNAYICCNSCIAEKINIGDGAVIGMGTMLARDVKADEFVLGNPPRSMGRADSWLKKSNGLRN